MVILFYPNLYLKKTEEPLIGKEQIQLEHLLT
jgi:hypothetical protein